jgi:hypothetical protein
MIHRSTTLALAIRLNKASTFTSILPSTSLHGLQCRFKLRPIGYSTDVYPGLKNDISIKISQMPTSVSIPTMNPNVIAADDKSMNKDSIDWFNTWLPLRPVNFLNREKPMPFQLLGMDIVIWNDGQVVEGGSGKPIGFSPKTKRPWNSW